MNRDPKILRHNAEEVAALLPPLLVQAERIAATIAPGAHGRRRVGPGETFWQFRRYQPGDPVTTIDWRQSAKSDPVFVRETEWSAAQSVWLWVDPSASMDYASTPGLPRKRDRAALLALALAALLVRGGEKVALLGDGQRPATGRAVLLRMATTLAEAEAGAGLPAPAALPRHAQLVLAGDFLAPLEAVDETARRLAGHSSRGHLLQIVDPAEESLPFNGRIRFSGMEREGELLVTRAEDVRDAYVDRVTRHREGLAAIARALGWTFSVHHTDQSPQSALLALYGLLAER